MILDNKIKQTCEGIVNALQQPLAIISKGNEVIYIIACEENELYNPGTHQYQNDFLGIDLMEKISTNEFTSVGSPTGTSDLITYFHKTDKLRYSISGFDVILIAREEE